MHNHLLDPTDEINMPEDLTGQEWLLASTEEGEWGIAMYELEAYDHEYNIIEWRDYNIENKTKKLWATCLFEACCIISNDPVGFMCKLTSAADQRQKERAK